MFLAQMFDRKLNKPSASTALPGRSEAIDSGTHHFLSGLPLHGPYPEGMETAMFGMGCFWGVERKFWELEGVYVTAVGYAAGYTPNATYKEVCSGMTGHNEVVFVVFDPAKIAYEALLKTFWEGHDPTQGNRQGNDIGTQYRSGIYTYSDEQHMAAVESKGVFQQALENSGITNTITTEILKAGEFYFAEEYHQQYLAKNPDGYCGVGGIGVSCPIGTGVKA
ncbi:MAG: peptide-methionine (S)-S-oxide reductase MsrA [Rhizobiaceae bacterium]|nr:peptide-methionine (S)-S-oxide reductase MsrA [Rhizobiaceae bacterium]